MALNSPFSVINAFAMPNQMQFHGVVR
jgi:hypothetical protein